MDRFLKYRKSLSSGLIFFLGLYFFIFPFLHYHPSDVHAHAGELQPHQHEGHFHSHELEALAHAWNFHPADVEEDQKRHHSHSSPEHDSDKFQINIEKVGLLYKNLSDLSKHKAFPNFQFVPQAPSVSFHDFLPNEIHSENDPGPFQERSPPTLFI